ncbi:hypothetical protein DAPPUDRAFT_232220 [Daphnia pulex]|uniref:Uncharacterized protein n=1 Tax=Daphnia pulex TaxID=6669 RepID=E9FS51_DAPPU|nr:hypothetical protein DAPPUDRAFT_232220 [Daphnia pulex]|eukprot:EFX89971.1 hypothetical protein DAPPUDRAFT_232220 [Daphnia pulex]
MLLLVYYVLIDLSNPMSSFPSNWPINPKMKLEASRFGNHAVHQTQIPEAEFTLNMYNVL